MAAQCCTHCGLPFRGGQARQNAYCCHACLLAATIVGTSNGQGAAAWHLLRLGIGILLAMNIMTISLLIYGGSIAHEASPPFRFLLLLLSAAALAMLLPPFLAGSFRELAARRLNLNLLIASGSLAAFGVSAVNTLAGAGEIYFDTATMLPVLVTAGTFLESGARGKASELLKGLEALLPRTALLVCEEGLQEVPLDRLQNGDLVRVPPGQRLSVDGTIQEGSSELYEAVVTGEYLPRRCCAGDRVIAGTVNGHGPLLVRADATGDGLLVAKIVAMVAAAWQQPTGYERIAERLAGRFIPLVLILAAATFGGWWLGGEPERAGLAALSVLVVACPCTFGIATPLATCLAVVRAAGSGMIVRDGSVLERAAAVRELWFDKTGTLTVGTPAVAAILPAAGTAPEELLARLSALEGASEHPLASAISEEARRRGWQAELSGEVKVHPGEGISGRVSWQGQSELVIAGRPEFAGTAGSGAEADDATVVDVRWGDIYRGRVLLVDRLRPDAPAAAAGLRNLGIRMGIASGDRHGAARKVAGAAGIELVEAPCPPDGKYERIRASLAAGRRTAMVGDGINDAPALATADVGFAMGGGTDLARGAGNVVMLSDRLELIPWLFGLSHATMAIVRQNFGWSIAYNGVALAAAAAGLLHPLLAAAAMVFSGITVVGNSLRIMKYPACGESYPEISRPTENAGPSSGPTP